MTDAPLGPYVLPPLRFDHAALKPFIDEATIRLGSAFKRGDEAALWAARAAVNEAKIALG